MCSSFCSTQLKQAYRDLIEVWHPDRFAHNPRLQLKAEAMTKLINAAYQRLQAAA
ncbi:MAG TPA: J domain-containing protein [Acidobacteriota bacterium]|nr:J domain-containing protein [Acidobacteriota bacterium]